MKALREKLAVQLDRDEGYERSAYRDSLGFWTIGRGHLIDKRKNAGLSDEVIELQFQIDVNEKLAALLQALPWASQLNEARLGALVNMAFQLGVKGVLGFPKMLLHLRYGRYQEAHDEAIKIETPAPNDEWPEQTPARAKRIAMQLLTGEWQ